MSESCPGHPDGDRAECLRDSGQRHRLWTQRTGDQILAPLLWLRVLECEPRFLPLQSGLMTLTLHCSPEKQTKHFKCLAPLTMTWLPREGPGVEKEKKERERGELIHPLVSQVKKPRSSKGNSQFRASSAVGRARPPGFLSKHLFQK